MYSSASSWLMTTLTTDPLMVSLVQVASSLPMFLFALPAGVLADILDKRRFLLVAETYVAVASTAFAVMVWLGLINPWSLLVLTFLIEAGSAVTSPPWQSIVPQLVPAQDLSSAVAMNSVGVNVSRAVGPALGGLFTSLFGIAAPFWVNAASNFGVIGALALWRKTGHRNERLPAERFVGAMRAGVRYALNNSYLQATLIRAIAFFLFASCYWALLPLVARNQLAGGPTLYGVLLGAIGLSAIVGALALPWLKKNLGSNGVVAAGTLVTALTLVLYAVADGPVLAVVASISAGISWIGVLANLNVSAQTALADWVRGRGLALYVTVFFGAMTLGSVIWGAVARFAGVPAALSIAAAGALLAIPLTWRWRLLTGGAVDLTPSVHWPTPVLSESVESDAGPVLVTVEYRVEPEHRDAFLKAMQRLSRERARDGAYAWGIFEDLADRGRFLETFLLDSWLEHLRQHARVTNADRLLQEEIERLVTSAPKVSHLLAATSNDSSDSNEV
jgi:MFS family permease